VIDRPDPSSPERGGFEEGQQAQPEDERVGQFSDGNEQLPDDESVGRFSEGQEELPDDEREGQFSDTVEPGDPNRGPGQQAWLRSFSGNRNTRVSESGGPAQGRDKRVMG
jgi:hypothetical protein